MPVPDLETLFGPPLPRNFPKLHELRDYVAQICKLDRPAFPGSQPVSFSKADIRKLETREYWVCEKSDGVRVLMLVLQIEDTHEVWLIDRRNDYREAKGFYFPHPADKTRPLGSSLFDGELLIDVNRTTGQHTTRLLVFDCLVCDQQNVMHKLLESRYGRLHESFLKPFQRMLREVPHMQSQLQFQLGVKKMELSYGVDKVLNERDTVRQSVTQSPASLTTFRCRLKWKPPNENSIDFKIELRFPPAQSGANAGGPDMRAKPLGGQDYEYHDLVDLDDAEWERMKASGEQYDDRIAEFNWNKERQTWQFMRFRDDKQHANNVSIVDKIIVSIVDGVRKMREGSIDTHQLLQHLPEIRHASKTLPAAAATSRPPHTNGHGHRQGQRPPQPPLPTFKSGQPVSTRALAPKQKKYHVGNRFSKVGGPPQILGWQR
ncbi:mRNA capping enzyme, alpha subunit [Auriculariales sp. MPI-PUGE-AT-0066]|nr:mRNA capping enzyme, alpha subunit [Auriculariales sp. MPI-PUGE-AT-0066]